MSSDRKRDQIQRSCKIAHSRRRDLALIAIYSRDEVVSTCSPRRYRSSFDNAIYCSFVCRFAPCFLSNSALAFSSHSWRCHDAAPKSSCCLRLCQHCTILDIRYHSPALKAFSDRPRFSSLGFNSNQPLTAGRAMFSFSTTNSLLSLLCAPRDGLRLG